MKGKPGTARKLATEKKMEYLLGIDLGTTNCTVTAVDERGNLKVIPNSEGGRITPSAVYFEEEENHYLVGQKAKDRAASDPGHRLVTLVKREMGKSRDRIRYNRLKRKAEPYVFWGREFSPAEVSSKILAQLKRDAERELGQPVSKAIITCPAYFGQNEKEATRKAGEYANLDVISILPEPTAAALAYVNGMKIRKRTERIFVFDLGGGTFDVTILEVSNGDRKNIEAKRCDGDSKLGGADWDETIVNYMVNRFYSVNKVNLLYEEGEARDSAYGRLTLDAERLKKELSSPGAKTATMTMSYGGATLTEEFTIEKYAEITASLNERCRGYCSNLLDDAGLCWGDIDMILMVGSMSNCLFLQRMLREWSGKETNFGIVDPKTCVSTGAAIMAHLLCHPDAAENPQPEREKDAGEGGVFLGGDEGSVDEAFDSGRLGVGVLPASIRLSAFDRNRKPLAYRMLSKNQPYPCEFKQKFPIQSPNQSTVNVTVLEGEDDDPEYCRAIGTSKLPLVGEHGRDDLVEVSFSVDMNGILQVYAIDLKSGERIDVEMDRNDGFNETAESVRKAAEDAAEFDVFLG